MMHRVMHIGGAMKPASKPTVTLRNLPPDLLRVIRKRAKERKTSLTKAAVGLLGEAAGTLEGGAARHLYHDLDGFAGRWTREEAAAFESALRSSRKVEEELWS
jgi:hypothetical protein